MAESPNKNWPGITCDIYFDMVRVLPLISVYTSSHFFCEQKYTEERGRKKEEEGD